MNAEKRGFAGEDFTNLFFNQDLRVPGADEDLLVLGKCVRIRLSYNRKWDYGQFCPKYVPSMTASLALQ